jgi:2-polyprenyl-3-methyl-5-hydroxy-6-metoxy-1,4-benzoquinol methylase
MTVPETRPEGIEYVKCNLCGADDAAVFYPNVPVLEYRQGIYSQDHWHIVRCRQCNLIYTNPRIDSSAREHLYSFQIQGDQKFVNDWFIESADLQRSVWQRFVRILQGYCPSGKLLDIGCGAGSFLVEARKMGYDVYGQEVSPYFINYCRDVQGLRIYADFLDNLDLAAGSFDCVTAFDVIEHHPNAKLLVTQMHQLIRPGGIVMIMTHDIGNIFARLHGVHWRYIMPIGHITYFTRQTLTQMLADSGFQVIRSGGLHTIERNRLKEIANYGIQFLKVVALRSLILGVYRPLAERYPDVTRWHFRLAGATINHEKLLVRAGRQIVMNDDVVVVARAAADRQLIILLVQKRLWKEFEQRPRAEKP